MSEKIYENLINAFNACLSEHEEERVVDNKKLAESVLSLFEDALEYTAFQKLKVQIDYILNPQISQEVFISTLTPFVNETIDHGKYNIIPRASINLVRYMDQIKKQVQLRGIDFNIMIVGRSGTGKSTLLNTLFNAVVARNQISSTDNQDLNAVARKCEMKSIKHIINDDGYKLRISMYDSVGYGDLVDNSNCFEIPLESIHEKFQSYYENEKRESIIYDERIHCCIYVIPPTGHTLSLLDIKCLKKLVEVTNVIPVIGRSDSLEPFDLEAFRKRVREKMDTENIICYPMKKHKLLCKSLDEDDIFIKKLPLVCIGANLFDEKTKTYIRRTPFGDINVNDSSICDNELLKDLLIRKNLHNIITSTHHIYYAKYRENL